MLVKLVDNLHALGFSLLIVLACCFVGFVSIELHFFSGGGW
jgi:hypothetical protein